MSNSLAVLRALAQAASIALLGGIFILMLWIALSIEDEPNEASLIGVLTITMGSVIIAAFFTAIIYNALNPSGASMAPGDVFRESIRRYAWIAAPIASGYGLSRIVVEVAGVISGVA